MSNMIKVSAAALFTGLLLTGWLADFSASAQEEHNHAHSPASAKGLKNPLAANRENIAAGRALYNQNCASCHGTDGKSRTQTAGAMKVRPTNLTGRMMQSRKDGDIYWVIANGISRSGMPAFKKLTTNQRWQVTLYVKHLMGDHPHAEHGKR
jgi:mono/diheme cytochrome c family protein